MDVISLYSVDEALPKQSNVYLCRPEQLGHLNDSYQNAVLLCIDNGASREPVPRRSSVLVVHCSQSLEFVFNALQKAIVTIKMNNGLIDRAILEQSDIQDILPIVEQTMKNPFCCWTPNSSCWAGARPKSARRTCIPKLWPPDTCPMNM